MSDDRNHLLRDQRTDGFVDLFATHYPALPVRVSVSPEVTELRLGLSDLWGPGEDDRIILRRGQQLCILLMKVPSALGPFVAMVSLEAGQIYAFLRTLIRYQVLHKD